jgi:TatD DNase family protein
LGDSKLDIIKRLCSHEKVVAYGELGLDFFHNFSPRDTQLFWFKRQLELAYEIDMPAVIHSRDAHDETAKLVEDSRVRKGVVHSFSGNADMAKFYVGLGFHVGIGGVVTFDRSGVLEGVVYATPLEWLLLETDCPYLTPRPYRGKRNDSAKLIYVAEKIAEIKGVTTDDVCRVTTASAKRLFGV